MEQPDEPAVQADFLNFSENVPAEDMSFPAAGLISWRNSAMEPLHPTMEPAEQSGQTEIGPLSVRTQWHFPAVQPAMEPPHSPPGLPTEVDHGKYVPQRRLGPRKQKSSGTQSRPSKDSKHPSMIKKNNETGVSYTRALNDHKGECKMQDNQTAEGCRIDCMFRKHFPARHLKAAKDKVSVPDLKGGSIMVLRLWKHMYEDRKKR